MKRPSFQFYPGDWRRNAKLRRCSEAARGAWMDILCVLHDSDEYGVCRWPLVDLARAAGVPLKLVRELVEKEVLKGGGKSAADFVYTPTHAGQDGPPVTLVSVGAGPCWYSSRLVRDEWVRQRRGRETRFDGGKNQPHPPPKVSPNPPPKGGMGDTLGDESGDGPSSPSSSSTSLSPEVLFEKEPKGGNEETSPPGKPPVWRERHRSEADRANATTLPSFVPEDFTHAWERWCHYRTTRAVDARTSSAALPWTVDAARACLSSCERNAHRLGWDRIIGQVDEAISGQWQGLNLERIPAAPGSSRAGGSLSQGESQRPGMKL